MNKKKIKILRSDRQNYRHNFRTKSYIQYWSLYNMHYSTVNGLIKFRDLKENKHFTFHEFMV